MLAEDCDGRGLNSELFCTAGLVDADVNGLFDVGSPGANGPTDSCRAGDMLAEDGLSVAEVASRAGYSSDLAFARAFKREYGVTPAEWRRQGAGA